MDTGASGYTTRRRVVGRVDTIGAHAVFGSVMALVALTLGCTALGAHIGGDLGHTPALLCIIAAAVAICLTPGAAERSEARAMGALFTAGLLLGLGLGPVLRVAVAAHPDAIRSAAETTAIFVAVLGAAGYSMRCDLGVLWRALLVAVGGLLMTALVAMLLSSPMVDRAYSIGGIVVFGGYTLFDFNRMRRAGVQDVFPLAIGIFLDAVNAFMFLLNLGSGES